MQTAGGYARALERMLAATRAWKAANPNAKLEFRPFGVRPDTAVIAALDRAFIRRVGGNPKTRELLHAMDAAIDKQGTALQAEACIEEVFGLPRALTVRWADGGPKRSEPKPPEPPTTTKVPESACPECGKELSAATFPSGKTAPSPGDFSVCAYCAAVLRFDDTLHLHATTLAERQAAPERIVEIVRAVSMTKPAHE